MSIATHQDVKTYRRESVIDPDQPARVFIPPTDDEEEDVEASTTASKGPTHYQPLAPRYAARLHHLWLEQCQHDVSHPTSTSPSTSPPTTAISPSRSSPTSPSSPLSASPLLTASFQQDETSSKEPSEAVMPATTGPALASPADFHTLTHWMELYVLGLRHNDKALQARCIDEVRAYYARTGGSASAFRIETLYKAVRQIQVESGVSNLLISPDLLDQVKAKDFAQPNGSIMRPSDLSTLGSEMKHFLLETAAWRLIREGRDPSVMPGLSETHFSGTSNEEAQSARQSSTEELDGAPTLTRSFRTMLSNDSEIAVDFVEALVKVGKERAVDPRFPDGAFRSRIDSAAFL